MEAVANDPPTFRVLGPLELGTPERLITLAGERQRNLLAVLLAARGATLSVDVLVELLWGASPPANPSAALHSQISRLRRSIADLLTNGCALVSRAPGYALVVAPGEVDSARFEQLVADARTADDGIDVYDDALRLWRGAAFAGFDDLPPAHLEGIRLDELRAAVVEERAEALLRMGQPELVVPELESFVAAHPLRERARGALMRALYATGRQVEALRHYEDYRHHLADELGLEPSAPLQRLQHRILVHDVVSTAPAPAPHAAAFGLEAMQVRYVRLGGGQPVAATTIGTGPHLVVVPAWVTSLDVIAAGRDPRSSLIEHLVRHATVTLYDRAGSGLSRGLVQDFSVERSADELLAILDECGGGTLLAVSQSGPTAITAAARRPDLVNGLVLFGTYANASGVFENQSQNQALVDLTRANFALGAKLLADLYRPGASVQAGEHLAQVLRDSADSSVAAGYLEQTYRTDVTALLERITQPALVLHYRRDRVVPFRGGEQLASGLPHARLISLDGPFHLPDAGDLPRIVELIANFLTDATPSV
jgi:DNA-binding SARP family transcriptional activator/pimeloyl-ACP methyl ester carboxylesterase